MSEENETPIEALTKHVTKTVMESVNTTLQNQLSDWSDSVTEKMLSKVGDMFTESTIDTTERAAKKLKLDNPGLQRAGCIDQYKHNAEIQS